MNALTDTPSSPARTPVVAAHRTHKFKLLLRREFWEHKGGFFWAPLIAGGISLLLTGMVIVVGLVAAHRAAGAGKLELDGVNVSGLNLSQLTQRIGAEDMAKFAQGLDLSLFVSSLWPFIVLAFVAFFYCLGALYDERKDRSVLFWKSLPLSDAQTVLSKVVSVALVAPALAAAASIATMFGFLIMISLVVLLHGGNPLTLLWAPANPLQIAASSIAWIPVYALWALPTVGWLLFCSAWARSKPFLWALMVPVFAGIFVSWFDLMELFKLDSSWFWAHVVGRLLLGTVPGMDMVYRDDFSQAMGPQNLEAFLHSLSPARQLAGLASLDVWVGAAVGIAFICIAVQLRRRRELAD